MPVTIVKAYTRHYRDNNQLTAYVEWSDGSRTEGPAVEPLQPEGLHMQMLFNSARRFGAPITHEAW
jgi:hypothetical protein